MRQKRQRSRHKNEAKKGKSVDPKTRLNLITLYWPHSQRCQKQGKKGQKSGPINEAKKAKEQAQKQRKKWSKSLDPKARQKGQKRGLKNEAKKCKRAGQKKVKKKGSKTKPKRRAGQKTRQKRADQKKGQKCGPKNGFLTLISNLDGSAKFSMGTGVVYKGVRPGTDKNRRSFQKKPNRCIQLQIKSWMMVAWRRTGLLYKWYLFLLETSLFGGELAPKYKKYLPQFKKGVCWSQFVNTRPLRDPSF